ncbi:MAG: hypothetical protein K2X82_12515 [Gemmataceae bacterium]|nr:hypothetical protein [Gemmataceae bacterium]
MADPKQQPATQDDQPEARQREGSHAPPQETTRAQEWGGREDQGKAIARGGKESGPAPGAEPAK